MAVTILLMGVSGSGKTTVGRLLAAQLGLPFFDGDDFHSEANVAKMQAAVPLDDEDRAAWLDAIGKKIQEMIPLGGAVFACSALKSAYRQRLDLAAASSIYWVHLHGDYALIQERLAGRKGHFMPPSLLQSQFDALEMPADALILSIEMPPDEIVQSIMDNLQIKPG
jgi:gluconokinase